MWLAHRASERRSLYTLGLAGLLVALIPFTSVAAPPDESTTLNEDDWDDDDAAPAPARIREVEVIGRQKKALQHVPGSAHVVTEEDLEYQAPTSGNEALRVVPGVHVRDEEGIGLRLNIGLRGLNPDRSRNLLVLEDGVPVSLAPYGEPELYYTPAIERMQRLEVVKGSGSILWGPQTIGGVLNYITKDPPKEFTVESELRGGNFGYMFGEVAIGDTVGDVGYRFAIQHKRFEGHRALNLAATDASAKFKLRLSPTSSLTLKLQLYDEMSNATYLGLTHDQYLNDPGANYAIHDVLPVKRYGLAATHNALLSDSVLVQTTLYASYTSRNWLRQDFDRAYNASRSYERIIDGTGRDILSQDPSTYPTDGSAIFFRNGTGARNRAFTVAGLESRLTWDYNLSDDITGELVGGARLHNELTEEQRINGTDARARSGALVADETRNGLALAAYLQNRFTFWDKLRVTPGLRIESLWYDRAIHRQASEDLVPSRSSDGHVLALIPGIGLSFDAAESVTIFGGVHRGFAPPRTKDAFGLVDGELASFELEAEFSWNYELGVRFVPEPWLWAEVTAFYMDFSNQVIAPTEAGGAIAEDARALVNGGESVHAGVEASVTFDLARAGDWGFRLPLTVNYTYVDATFGDSWKEQWVGNRLPYAPEHLLSLQLRFVHDSGFSAQINGNWISSQFTDADNTVAIAPDGRIGKIDGRFLLDARVAYTFADLGLTAYVSGKNLTDTRFIAAMAPAGIQPGMFRQVFGGLSGRF